jgi:hypothetical protein
MDYEAQIERDEQERARRLTFAREAEVNHRSWHLTRDAHVYEHLQPQRFQAPTEVPLDRPPVSFESLPADLASSITIVESGCWIWKRGRHKYVPVSYGTCEWQGHRTTAHRAVWLATVGPIPLNGQVDHLCEVKRCVNPAHLELVTPGMNTLRHHARREHENAFLESRRAPDGGAPLRSLERVYGTAACAFCGNPFRKRRDWQTYCSDKCRKDGWTRMGAVQQPLDFAPQPIPPVVDQRVPRRDVARLAGHNATVLDRLRAGSASGADLERLLGPGSAWRTRVSDVRRWLRRRGETVACRRDEAGVYTYTLEAL